MGLGSSGGAGVPAVGEPGVVAELADDDDCVGQGVDDFDAAFGAVGEFLESVVVSGVGLFNWSAPGRISFDLHSTLVGTMVG